jgi:hypothetical protein
VEAPRRVGRIPSRCKPSCSQQHHHPIPHLQACSRRYTCTLDAGVMVIDVHAWKRDKVTAESERWMRLQRDQPTCLYEPGVMPHLLLALAGRIKNIDSVSVAGSCWAVYREGCEVCAGGSRRRLLRR